VFNTRCRHRSEVMKVMEVMEVLMLLIHEYFQTRLIAVTTSVD